MNVSKDVSALPKSDLRQQNIGAVQNQFCGTQMLCSVFKCRSSTLINVMFLKIVPSNINEICTGPVNQINEDSFTWTPGQMATAWFH